LAIPTIRGVMMAWPPTIMCQPALTLMTSDRLMTGGIDVLMMTGDGHLPLVAVA